jgi:maleate isomerase
VAGDRAIIRAIADATDQTATSTASAVAAALHAVGARTISLLTPYVDATHRQERAFLEESGFQVARDRYLGHTGSDAYVGVLPEAWITEASALAEPEVEAEVIGCTNIRAIEVIGDLEARIDRPVVTSNQAVLWQALRLGGLDDQITGLGRLFRAAAQEERDV